MTSGSTNAFLMTIPSLQEVRILHDTTLLGYVLDIFTFGPGTSLISELRLYNMPCTLYLALNKLFVHHSQIPNRIQIGPKTFCSVEFE